MNQQERDALREKHRDWSGHCPVCHTETACDVIKVLDAWEAVVHGSSEVSATREVCDHWVGVRGSGHYRYGSNTPPAYWTHTYCPKCGEKL
jgi:hypothetical protein